MSFLNDDKFNPGDAVTLRNFSIIMTVEVVEAAVRCCWYDKNAQLQRASFSSEILQLESPR